MGGRGSGIGCQGIVDGGVGWDVRGVEGIVEWVGVAGGRWLFFDAVALEFDTR